MEYLGFISLGVAVAGVGLRAWLLMKAKATPQFEPEQRKLSPRARRAQEATIARRLLRYHRGLSHA